MKDLKDKGLPFGLEELNEVYLQHEKENDLPQLIAAERPGSRAYQRLQGLYTAWRLATG